MTEMDSIGTKSRVVLEVSRVVQNQMEMQRDSGGEVVLP